MLARHVSPSEPGAPRLRRRHDRAPAGRRHRTDGPGTPHRTSSSCASPDTCARSAAASAATARCVQEVPEELLWIYERLAERLDHLPERLRTERLAVWNDMVAATLADLGGDRVAPNARTRSSPPTNSW
ncbi:hypothetical protein ACU686_33515 [Yinghuangia aomiensis]